VVVDAHDVCANLDQAQTALRDALGGSVAPEQGWRLRVFDERRGTHVFVTANLDDAQGNAVAHRVIDATSSDRCDGVISALGVWAALVLDAEVSKAKAHPKPTTPTLPTTVTGDNATNTPSVLVPSGVAINADAGAPPPQRRTIEIGSSATLMNSPLTTTDAALVGGDVFMLIEIVRSFFLRPAVAGASSLGSTAAYVAPRMDACLRVPGNYVEHRGLLLETCAGTEFGVFDHGTGTTHATDALFAIGPTIGLRGDLASDLSVEVRGLANFNVVHTGDEIALLSLRAELGLTWRLR
jgi:hypothetical protein